MLYQVAKEFRISSDALIGVLQKLGYEVIDAYARFAGPDTVEADGDSVVCAALDKAVEEGTPITAEFLDEISQSLNEDGFYVMNLIDHGDFDFLRAELATARRVFPHVGVVTVPQRFDVGGNFMLVGSKVPIPGDRIVASSESWIRTGLRAERSL